MKAANMPKAAKRPRDLNQWAKRMVDIAVGEVQELPTAKQTGGRTGGEKGGSGCARVTIPNAPAGPDRLAYLR
jgi:hypothetical protein